MDFAVSWFMVPFFKNKLFREKTVSIQKDKLFINGYFLTFIRYIFNY